VFPRRTSLVASRAGRASATNLGSGQMPGDTPEAPPLVTTVRIGVLGDVQ
jgi:hypothetical protein